MVDPRLEERLRDVSKKLCVGLGKAYELVGLLELLVSRVSFLSYLPARRGGFGNGGGCPREMMFRGLKPLCGIGSASQCAVSMTDDIPRFVGRILCQWKTNMCLFSNAVHRQAFQSSWVS